MMKMAIAQIMLKRNRFYRLGSIKWPLHKSEDLFQCTGVNRDTNTDHHRDWTKVCE